MSWWRPLPQAKLTQGFLFVFHCDACGSIVTMKTIWKTSTCLWMSCRRCPQQRGAPGGPRPLTVLRPWRAPQMKLQLLAPARWVRWRCSPFHCLPSPGIQLRQGQHGAFMPVLPALWQQAWGTALGTTPTPVPAGCCVSSCELTACQAHSVFVRQHEAQRDVKAQCFSDK